MSDGLAFLYSTLSRDKIFHKMEQQIKQKGIKLEYPINNLVQIWNEEGEYQRLSRVNFLEKLVSNNKISFQWWWNEEDDLYCRIRSVDGYTSFELGLDGVNRNQILNVVKLFFSILGDRLKEDVIGFVIDRNAYTEEYDWDTFFINDKLSVLDLPIILGLNSQKKFLYDASEKCRFDLSIVESVIVAKKVKGFGNYFRVVVLGE
ncbi:MAG: hypothetical protein M1130_09765 [Actinobacteria bacterium]|nr:hypothetical protein [Actinomycetota bacterium]